MKFKAEDLELVIYHDDHAISRICCGLVAQRQISVWGPAGPHCSSDACYAAWAAVYRGTTDPADIRRAHRGYDTLPDEGLIPNWDDLWERYGADCLAAMREYLFGIFIPMFTARVMENG